MADVTSTYRAIAGVPATVTVAGCSDLYNGDYHVHNHGEAPTPGLRWENKPVWCLHNGTATIQRGDSGSWELEPVTEGVQTIASLQKTSQSGGGADPCGTWEGGVTVTAKRETPSMIAKLAFPAPEFDYNFYATGQLGAVDIANGVTDPRALLNHTNTRFLRTVQGEVVPAIRVRHQAARCTILYSHGNGEDLGDCTAATCPAALALITFSLQCCLVLECQIIHARCLCTGLIQEAIEELSVAVVADVLAYDYVGYSTSRCVRTELSSAHPTTEQSERE